MAMEHANVQGFGPSYPDALAAAEAEAVRERRLAAGLAGDDLNGPGTGIAISGGGIRSAIIALGVFQSLAAADRLKRVDYLSTVSGGSYFGAFFGALFARGHDHAGVRDLLRTGGPRFPGASTMPGPTTADGRDRIDPVAWLRQNGRYLAPRGGTDEFLIFALTLRNWLALALVTASVLLTGCLAVQLLWQSTTHALAPWIEALSSADWTRGSFCIGHALYDDRCANGGAYLSTTAVAGIPPLAFAAVCGFAYWFVGLFFSDHMKQRRWRARLTAGLAGALTIVAGVAAWVAIDSIALTLRSGVMLDVGTLGSAGLVGAIVLALRKVLTFPAISRALSELWSTAHVPIRIAAWPLAILLWGGVLIALDVLALELMRVDREVSLPWLGAFGLRPPQILAGLAIVQIALAFLPYFLNRSSQHAFYAERLIRTFVGASNPARFPHLNRGRDPDNAYISDPIAGDDVDFGVYHGQSIRHGGPLHLINVTVNETRSPYAATVLRDRNGVQMSIGPAGISAGVYHHALDAAPRSAGDANARWPLASVAAEAGSNRFQMFGSGEFQAERLSLGYWAAISGAAVSTGLGSYGGTALSLLISFVNLRLGYWWHAATVGEVAAVAPSGSIDVARANLSREARQGWRPMQAYLFSEVLGRFWGPHRPRWYLSDGGHSENTGALELIRRRLPEIVVLDTENSSVSPTGNLGELVRKARQDYFAEITFDEDAAAAPFGPYLGLIPGPDGRGATSAVRGRIRYLNAGKGERAESRLLYIRPVLSDRDAPDLLRYATDNKDFPYQSTADQFFDEAQWESYRRLGERIGEDVFG